MLFTSECVSAGHPDKVADQISDAILDHCLLYDPMSRVACETLVTTNTVILAGEITTEAPMDDDTIDDLVRKTISDIGYTDSTIGFSSDNCRIHKYIHSQSSDIARGVDAGGAGDQGMMFGYACDETEQLMPMPMQLSRQIMLDHAECIKFKKIPFLRPDAKSQVTVEYSDNKPSRLAAVVLSTQHDETVLEDGKFSKSAKDVLIEKLIQPAMKKVCPQFADAIFHVNPTGSFLIGGPHGDTGLTGRKIIVDTYGGAGRHGGGAFSGKDPTKVDRSAAYMARYIAKNLVAARGGSCEVQLAYVIGEAKPVSVYVNGSNQEIVDKFDLTPHGIIEFLDLRKPKYLETAKKGHFGVDNSYRWEKIGNHF